MRELGPGPRRRFWTDADRTARIEAVKTPKEWSVYLVRCADKSLYTGIAKDVKARVAAHNLGKGAAYTRSRKPVRLVFHRNGMTRSAALIEEARIKSLERTEKLVFLKKASKAAGRAAAALALMWALAAPARAIPVFNKENGISLSSATPPAGPTPTCACTTCPPSRAARRTRAPGRRSCRRPRSTA
jgi:putative endonuclease